MNRLFCYDYEKNFGNYKIKVVMSRIGQFEFSELRKKYVDRMKHIKAGDVEDIMTAINEQDNEKLMAVRDRLGIDVFNAFEDFTKDLMVISLQEICLRGQNI